MIELIGRLPFSTKQLLNSSHIEMGQTNINQKFNSHNNFIEVIYARNYAQIQLKYL